MELALKGWHVIQHVRDGKVLQSFRVPNGIVDEGLNDLLDTNFNDGTQKPAWYIGLIDNSGYTGVANTDTLTSHPGWSEGTPYSGNRKLWDVDAPTGRAIANGTPAEFSITSTASIRGIMVTSAETGTTGVLWSTALFSSPVSVESGDTLKITYTVSG